MQFNLVSVLAASTLEDGRSGGMLFASWAIILVLLAMSFVFLRSGKKEYAAGILPLIITPFVNIFSGFLARPLYLLVPLSVTELRAIITLTAGLISCLLLGLAARHIEGLRTRHIYFWFCAAFVVILTLVLVINEMSLIK